jgi:hypothetical protein
VKKVSELTDFGAEEKISIDTNQHQLTPSPTHNALGWIKPSIPKNINPNFKYL